MKRTKVRRLRGAAAVLLLAVLGACSKRVVDRPQRHDLAQLYAPRPIEALLAEWNARRTGAPPLSLAADAEGSGWIEVELPAAAWRRDGELWRTEYPLPYRNDELRVRRGETTLVQQAPGADPADFGLEGSSLWLRASDGVAPADLHVATRLEGGRREDERWRIAVADTRGAGFPLLADGPSFTLALPERAQLRFFATARAPGGRKDVEQLGHFRVWLDGELVHDVAQAVQPGVRGAWHTVELPGAGERRLRLAFDGPPAFAAVLAPTIVEARPEPQTAPKRRPDLVLFLADTFRADNLAAYRPDGGSGPTPRIDAFAQRSVRFKRAWAPASWTLPSQASMMTGVFPLQHGATSHGRAIPAELVTLAEHLASFGYRTGGITDAAYVSSRCGFAQGFEWFEEHKDRDVRKTLRSAREFLEAGDGRPSFLFVQTYRVHHPYRTGPEEETADWDAFFARHADDFDLPILRMRSDSEAESRADAFDRKRDAVGELRALYEAGVRDLDDAFGTWFDGLERDGLLANAALVWTSDHGEAFAEHGELWHGGDLWEELVRVPLLVFGSWLEPRDVDLPATLVDLPRTFAALAGVPPLAAWEGDPLLSLRTERPVFGFGRGSHASRMVLVDGGRKIFAALDPQGEAPRELRRAFDLATDPDERQNLVANVPWAEGLLDEHDERIRSLMLLLVDPSSVSGANWDDLGDLGYGE